MKTTGCVMFCKDQLDLAKSMEEYLNSKTPDCSLFSEDGFEFHIHKELLYQTKLMRDMVKNNQLCHCSKIDIIVPALQRKKLEKIVHFLETGELRSDKTAISDLLVDLTELFGFPKKIDMVFEFPKVKDKKEAFEEIVHNDVKLENQDMKSDPLSICDMDSSPNNKEDSKQALKNILPNIESNEQSTNQISSIDSKKIEINNSLSSKRNLIRPKRLKECKQDKYKKRGGPYCCVMTGSSHTNHQS